MSAKYVLNPTKCGQLPISGADGPSISTNLLTRRHLAQHDLRPWYHHYLYMYVYATCKTHACVCWSVDSISLFILATSLRQIDLKKTAHLAHLDEKFKELRVLVQVIKVSCTLQTIVVLLETNTQHTLGWYTNMLNSSPYFITSSQGTINSRIMCGVCDNFISNCNRVCICVVCV